MEKESSAETLKCENQVQLVQRLPICLLVWHISTRSFVLLCNEHPEADEEGEKICTYPCDLFKKL